MKQAAMRCPPGSPSRPPSCLRRRPPPVPAPISALQAATTPTCFHSRLVLAPQQRMCRGWAALAAAAGHALGAEVPAALLLRREPPVLVLDVVEALLLLAQRRRGGAPREGVAEGQHEAAALVTAEHLDPKVTGTERSVHREADLLCGASPGRSRMRRGPLPVVEHKRNGLQARSRLAAAGATGVGGRGAAIVLGRPLRRAEAPDVRTGVHKAGNGLAPEEEDGLRGEQRGGTQGACNVCQREDRVVHGGCRRGATAQGPQDPPCPGTR